jgi:hypothetical protein
MCRSAAGGAVGAVVDAESADANMIVLDRETAI